MMKLQLIRSKRDSLEYLHVFVSAGVCSFAAYLSKKYPTLPEKAAGTEHTLCMFHVSMGLKYKEIDQKVLN